MGAYLPETVEQGCSLLTRCLNLHPGDCGVGVQLDYAMSEPTSQGLLGRGAACLCGVGIYLPETVGQGCSLFKWCLNLPSKDCGTGLQPVFTVLEPTSSGLRARGAACLCGVRTYLLGIVGYGCNLFMQYRNLPLGDCMAGVQPIYAVLEPTSQRLWTEVQPVYVDIPTRGTIWLAPWDLYNFTPQRMQPRFQTIWGATH